MPIEFGVKVVEVGNSLRFAIPKENLRAAGVQKVDTPLMTTIDSQILLREGGGHTTERAQTKRLGATTQTDSPVSWAKKLRHTFSVNPGGPTTRNSELSRARILGNTGL